MDYDALVDRLINEGDLVWDASYENGFSFEYAKSTTLNRHARQAHTDAGGDFGCRDCGAVHASNDLHHRDDDPHNNSTGNLIPLCRSCHTIRHNKQGRG